MLINIIEDVNNHSSNMMAIHQWDWDEGIVLRCKNLVEKQMEMRKASSDFSISCVLACFRGLEFPTLFF